ncbi:MAG: hypothetical protein A3G07_00360 [Candidatus Doudnabacteria bacterium RIFCSPLOWO2_12_FULL_47_12]|nr:MAG: hypothetical protein A3G07_00360 [Candidatus Doudnabacteria bacterium RIFCSPLOWO2_12_FULL_47_12]
MSEENVSAGVNYALMKNFKKAMAAMGETTLEFSRRWDVETEPDGLYHYVGPQKTHRFKSVIEGLGNKDWLAGWMEEYAGDGKPYREDIPVDSMMMAVNDGLAKGGRPFGYQDEITAPNSDFFGDEKRNVQLVRGYFKCCRDNGIALTQGETAPYVYLLHTTLPTFDENGKKIITSAPFDAASYSGAVQVVIAPASRYVNGSRLRPGHVILGTSSSEWCSNGASVYIKRVSTLPDKFLTKLPNGKTFGEQTLIPTKSMVPLVAALQDAEVDITAMGPITGDGVAKAIAITKLDVSLRIRQWPFAMPLSCLFVMDKFNISMQEMLHTFNCGLQYVICILRSDVTKAQDAAARVGFDLYEIGVVEEGQRCTIMEPFDNLVLPEPGD